jgi:gliding motility-associated lipoprotein GldH
MHTVFPKGQRLDQLLSLELANKAGAWNGECSGKTCTALIVLQQGTFFNQLGKYKLTIEQFMRYEPVKGINKIGFLMEKTEVDKSSFLKTSRKKTNHLK